MMKLIKFALENKSTPFDVKSNKPNLRSHRNAIIGQVTMLHKLYGLRSFSVWKPKKPKTNKRPVFPIINHDNKKDKITKPPHFLCLFFLEQAKRKRVITNTNWAVTKTSIYQIGCLFLLVKHVVFVGLEILNLNL